MLLANLQLHSIEAGSRVSEMDSNNKAENSDAESVESCQVQPSETDAFMEDVCTPASQDLSLSPVPAVLEVGAAINSVVNESEAPSAPIAESAEADSQATTLDFWRNCVPNTPPDGVPATFTSESDETCAAAAAVGAATSLQHDIVGPDAGPVKEDASEVGPEVADAVATAVGPMYGPYRYGCPKCRWSPRGCAVCQRPNYIPWAECPGVRPMKRPACHCMKRPASAAELDVPTAEPVTAAAALDEPMPMLAVAEPVAASDELLNQMPADVPVVSGELAEFIDSGQDVD